MSKSKFCINLIKETKLTKLKLLLTSSYLCLKENKSILKFTLQKKTTNVTRLVAEILIKNNIVC